MRIINVLSNHCRPDIASFDVRLAEADEADEHIDTVAQPDLSVICDPAEFDDKWIGARCSQPQRVDNGIILSAADCGVRWLS